MDKTLHDTSRKMEEAGTDSDYVIGWQSGYLHNPRREEQRAGEAYTAGYDDGLSGRTDGYSSWAR